jgi:hypothetical protein
MASYRNVRLRIGESDEPESDDERYAGVREALAPEYADLPNEAIEALLENLYPGADPADIESFFSSLKKVGKAAAKIGKKALPGVIQGVTKGAALGPFGMIAGGIAGGALSAASKGAFGRRVGGAVRGIAKRLPSRGAIANLVGSPAATQLLRAINRPEINQALRSLSMGGAGRRNVNIGGVNVPTGAVTTALRQLLEQVETELHEFTAGESGGAPQYLLGSDGEFAVDPTDETARADRVLELLARAEAAEGGFRRAEQYEYYRVEEYDEDDEAAEEDELTPEDRARILYPGVYSSIDD